MKLFSLTVFLFLATLSHAATRGAYPPPIDRSASRAAQAAQRGVQNEVTAANARANTVAANLRKEFEEIPDWVAASTGFRKANAEYEAGKKVVMDRLKEDPQYKTAKAGHIATSGELERVKAAGGDVFAAATKSMNAGNAVSKLEGDAFAADAAVADARRRMLEWKAKMDELSQIFDEQIRADQEWLGARREAAAAEERLAAAKQMTNLALAREAEQERQRQLQIRQIDQAYADQLAAERESNRANRGVTTGRRRR